MLTASVLMPRAKATLLVIGMAMVAAAADIAAQTQTAPSARAPRPTSATPATPLPDVVGIRPGISAQEAYDLLKARSPNAKIGVGQFTVPGVTDKPVAVSMAVKVIDRDPPEVLTVWLTAPPSKQVVWAVGREIEFEQNKQLLKSTVIGGLRQKYGPEVDSDQRQQFWAFDEQGNRIESSDLKTANCMNRNWSLIVAPPPDATYDIVTPLMYTLGPRNPCDSLVGVKATLVSPANSDYVLRVTVIVSDLGLARRSQEAYQAFLAKAAAAKNKEELEKAKERKAPAF